MPEQPNILVIMTDQQRGDCLSAAGHPALMTPNMDSIGGAGIRFSRAYSTCPVCVPARRSFLSGQHSSTHGVRSNANSEWEGPTLPGLLRDAGYQTHWAGRSMHQSPPYKRYGFESMAFKDFRMEDDYDEFLQRNQPEGGGGYNGTGVMHNDFTARSWHLDESLHATNWTVAESLKFMKKRDRSCPFFLVTSFVAPHPPLVPPAFYMDRYLRLNLPEPAIGTWETPPERTDTDVSHAHVNLQGELLRSARAAYYGLINHVDDQIRNILNPEDFALKKVLRNTIVLFLSDHGEMLGDHYRWRKSLPYEGAAHIPFLIKAPDSFGLRSGEVESTPVCIEDVMPTLLAMAGVACPDSVDGENLLSLMQQGTPLERSWLHLETSPEFHAVTDGKSKFIWLVEDGQEQFFDLESDPDEKNNRIDQPEDQEKIDTWRQRLIGRLRDREEGFVQKGELVPGRPFPSLRG